MIVYLATNSVNGMQYVGLTRRKNIAPRIIEHFAKAKHSKKGSRKTIAHAIRIYGQNAFTFEILDRVENLKNLSRAEKYWINKLNTKYPNGYNVKSGGCPTFKLAAGDLYEIDGKKYYGCGDLAEHFPVSVHNIRHRILRAGWTVRQAVEIDAPPARLSVGKPISVMGKDFASIKEACKHHGISDNIYFSRKRQGWSFEEIFGIKKRERPTNRGTKIIIGDLLFPSISKASKHFGIRAGCVTQRLAKGWSIEEAFGLEPRQSHPASIRIKEFNSISEAGEKTGISASTISWRIRNGWTLEQAVGLDPMHGNNQNLRKNKERETECQIKSQSS
jgi:hypothetical protein